MHHIQPSAPLSPTSLHNILAAPTVGWALLLCAAAMRSGAAWVSRLQPGGCIAAGLLHFESRFFQAVLASYLIHVAHIACLDLCSHLRWYMLCRTATVFSLQRAPVHVDEMYAAGILPTLCFLLAELHQCYIRNLT